MKIYTDGATSNNGAANAQGGWAYVIINDVDTIVAQDCGHIDNATNNICELTALIKACEAAKVFPTFFTIYSDSAYAINCYKQQWYKKWEINGWKTSAKLPVANKELWEKLIPFFEDNKYNFEKVKGHANDKWNNLVDELAVKAKEK